MATNNTKSLIFVFFLLSTLLYVAKASQEDSNSSTTNDGNGEVNVAGIVSALEKNGYKAMSSTLNSSLSSLISSQNSTSFTIFSPTDIAFASLRNLRPLSTFLAYHVTPYYLPRDDLELRTETLRMYSGIDTLLPGNSLVVTSQVPHLNSDSDFEAELNLVKIMDWNIYDDGQVIVHGIQDFFNPAAQEILFPQVQHHEIIKTTVESQSQEEGYFSIQNHPSGFVGIFALAVLAVSGLIFVTYLSIYGRPLDVIPTKTGTIIV